MRLNFLVPLLALSACTAAGDDAPECTGGKCDVDQTCDDPRYGDGSCQTSLSCGVPDIDCFMTFDSDEAAATWFTGIELTLAKGEFREARKIVPTSDPRHAKIRELLDRGWEAFREHRAVGMLADKRPALVLVDDPMNNAFVAADFDSDLSAFSVQVQTGLIAANAPDAANLGVMMHELQHAVGLHLIGKVREQTRRFYIAPANLPEPIGREQEADSRATTAGVAWMSAAEEVGPFSNAELGGMPLVGQLEKIFELVASSGNQQNPTGCAHALQITNQVHGDILASVDPLDTSLTIELATLPPRIDAALTAMRDECLPGFTKSFIDVIAAINNTTPQAIEASLSQHDRDLVTGKHIMDAIAAVAADRRAAMRAAEQSFTTATGRPWSAMRYFSIEEDADDVSVSVLRGAGLDAAGQGTFLLTAIPNERARCEALLDAGELPPYGVDLGDEHHATCWRVHHIRTLAKTAKAARPTPAPAPAVTVPARLPMPARPGDRVSH